MQNLLNDNLNIIPKSNLRQTLLLVALAGIMIFIRVFPIFQRIFTDWPGDYGNYVNFSADDAVYHMRLVHNTLHHMPWRVFFDPFTHFPYGNQIHFGPLFTLVIAFASFIAGLGNPTPELVNIIGAYTPVVMGALCLLPTYYIARILFDKNSAIITAFILAFLPGEFLQRSSLGFTDHHVAEVLFSTTAYAFIIHALNIAREKNFFITKPNQFFLKLSIFAGIAFGLFLLTWPAALMFGIIFLVFLITQLTNDHLNDNKVEYLLLLAGIIYILPTIMVLPYSLMNPRFELPYYSLTQPLILISMLVVFIVCYFAHLACKRHYLAKNLYFLIILLIFGLTIFISYHLLPKLFAVAQEGCKLLFEPKPGMRTVTEVRSSLLNKSGNGFSLNAFKFFYSWAGLFALFGLGNLFYRVYKNGKPAEVFLLIWSVAIILAAIAQIRFNYYLAINVAILAGCYGFYFGLKLLSDLKFFALKTKKLLIYSFFCLFAFLIVDPIFQILARKISPSGIQISQNKYNTYMWLKKNTPDPQGEIIKKDFDYTSGYYPIPKDPNLPYNYPKSAYGIMSWWNVGHQITYIAKRIPNSNPFQVGIIENNNTEGAALFFTSTDEEKTVKNLNAIGTRYIFIDYADTINLGPRVGVWCNDVKGWEKSGKMRSPADNKTDLNLLIDSEKFKQSITNRLFFNDADKLKHFRLIHEADGKYIIAIRSIILKPKPHPNIKYLKFEKYEDASKKSSKINKMPLLNKRKTVLMYNARPPAKVIKIFEKVKGAIITGTALKQIKDGTEATLSLKLKTKFDRIFTYTQTTKIKNGKFKFIVPYPTEAMRGNNYSYDIEPLGRYKLKIGDKITEIFVPEKAIMAGNIIKVLD